jgi:hypothetical protein
MSSWFHKVRCCVDDLKVPDSLVYTLYSVIDRMVVPGAVRGADLLNAPKTGVIAAKAMRHLLASQTRGRASILCKVVSLHKEALNSLSAVSLVASCSRAVLLRRTVTPNKAASFSQEGSLH